MLKKTIKYVDFEGNDREEPFHFNLSKAELMEMQLSSNEGLEKMIQRIVDTQDAPQIVAMFKKIILQSYGEISSDGKRELFRKKAVDGHKLADDFEQTEAYSELFMELSTNPDAASEFIKGILPRDLQGADPIPMPANK